MSNINIKIITLFNEAVVKYHLKYYL